MSLPQQYFTVGNSFGVGREKDRGGRYDVKKRKKEGESRA